MKSLINKDIMAYKLTRFKLKLLNINLLITIE